MISHRIVYVVSNIDKALSFEWLAEALAKRYQISFVLLNKSGSALEHFLLAQGIEFKRFSSATKLALVYSIFRTWGFLMKKKPRVLHAHLLEAQLVGLTAGWLARVPVRVYTRHNSNYHHVYFPRSVWMDIISNKLANKIISISSATDYTLYKLENVPKDKVVKIPHGFRFEYFIKPSADKIREVVDKWNIYESQRPIIGVIARHIEWKGVQYVVDAFIKFRDQYPNACLILANASGPYHDAIINRLSVVPVNSYRIIPFESAISGLYSLFDIYVHTPIDSVCEAFGQTYVEALAAGVPSVFTQSGVAPSFVVHGKNALVAEFKDSSSILDCMIELWKDEDLRARIAMNGRHDVLTRFSFDDMVNLLNKLYDE